MIFLYGAAWFPALRGEDEGESGEDKGKWGSDASRYGYYFASNIILIGYTFKETGGMLSQNGRIRSVQVILKKKGIRELSSWNLKFL